MPTEPKGCTFTATFTTLAPDPPLDAGSVTRAARHAWAQVDGLAGVTVGVGVAAGASVICRVDVTLTGWPVAESPVNFAARRLVAAFAAHEGRGHAPVLFCSLIYEDDPADA